MSGYGSYYAIEMDPVPSRSKWSGWAFALGGIFLCSGVTLLAMEGLKAQALHVASITRPSQLIASTHSQPLRAIQFHDATPVENMQTYSTPMQSTVSEPGLRSALGSSVFLMPLVAAAVATVFYRMWAQGKPEPQIAMAAVASETVEYSTIKFPPLKNDRVLRTARGEPVDRIPVWIMRQAGRYLPEYRKFMADKEFFQVCRNPKQVAEITLQPILRYDLDASIIFSDILVIPQAMGCSITLHPEKGPVFKEPVDCQAAWTKLQDELLGTLGLAVTPSMSSADKTKVLVENASRLVSPALDYVYAAITETRMQLDGRVPLLGFCGAPMTLAIYMIEGGGSRTFAKTSRLFHGEPQTAHEMLTVLSHMCAHYLMNQVRAGAQALQVFDSYAGALSPEVWHEFSYPYMQLIADLVKKEFPQMPMICFAKDAHYGIDALTKTKYDIIALDSSVDLGENYRRIVKAGKGIQGNLDPTVLYAPPAKIKEIVAQAYQKAFGDMSTVPSRYIANMGHGMSPDHDPEHLGAFIDAIHAFKPK